MHDQREFPRYSYREGAAAPFVTIYPTGSAPIRAQVRDIGEGGVGIRGEHDINKDQVVRCTLSLPEIPVPIPTLMRVQWSREMEHGYLIGLQFLI